MNQLEIMEILQANKDKDFVNRILNSGDFPSLPNRDGSESTQGMTWGEFEGKFFVYPTVVYEEDEMQRLGPDTAWGRALRTGDFIEFKTIQEAYEFSKKYKDFSDRFYKDQLEPEKMFPKRKTIWKDLNTGPGTISESSE